jgi:hypothetical protein
VKVISIGEVNTAPDGPNSSGTETMLEAVGGAGTPAVKGATVNELNGLPAAVLPTVPAGIVMLERLSADFKVTGWIKVPFAVTLFWTFTDPVATTGVVGGGGVEVVVVVVVDVVVPVVVVVIVVVTGGGA